MADYGPERARLSIGLGVRPPRVAIAVPSIKGLSWIRVLEQVLAAQARIWGGSANLAFSLGPGFAESELFWALIDRFDPDAWVTHVVSGGDMAELDPSWFDRHEKQLREQLAKHDESTTERFVREDRQIAIQEAKQPDAKQWRELVERGAPFHYGADEPSLDWVTTRAPQWPLADVAAFAGLPRVVKNPTTSHGPVLQLLLTVELGRLVPDFADALATQEIAIEAERLDDKNSLLRALFRRQRSEEWVDPWALSDSGLASYGRRHPIRPAVTLVVGDSPWDFTLFYALRRWTSFAFWLPSWLRRNRIFLHYLLNAITSRALRNGGPVVVTTTSPKTGTRDEVAQLVREHQTVRSVPVETAPWGSVLPDEPNRLLERGNFGVPRQVIPIEGALTTELPTPLPRRVTSDDPSELRWLTEVEVVDWEPIRHPAVGKAVLHAYGPELQRTTRGGLAYFCPHYFTAAGAELETMTIRPRLAPLSLLDQLRAIVEPKGWACDLSDKGVYAAETMRLFGGQRELVVALRRASLMRLFHAYVRGDEGREVADGRRCLSQRHIAAVVGAEAENLVDWLVSNGVLTRGLVLKCRRCRRTGWYSLDQLGHAFACRRCRLEQPVDPQWVGNSEPAWFYELAEVVHQFIEHNGDLPGLAAEKHFGATDGYSARVVEVEFTPPTGGSAAERKQKKIEIDLVVLEGHRLWLGEAATDLRPSRNRLKTLHRLACGTSAHGVLLATAAGEFPTSVVNDAQTIFASHPTVALATDLRAAMD